MRSLEGGGVICDGAEAKAIEHFELALKEAHGSDRGQHVFGFDPAQALFPTVRHGSRRAQNDFNPRTGQP